jgi:hypothetical protein
MPAGAKRRSPEPARLAGGPGAGKGGGSGLGCGALTCQPEEPNAMTPTPAEPNGPQERPRDPEPRTGSRAPLHQAYNRDDEMKPGRPPRSAYEPEGAEDSTRNAKTMTDPASGEPQAGAPAPAASNADETDPSDAQ